MQKLLGSFLLFLLLTAIVVATPFTALYAQWKSDSVTNTPVIKMNLDQASPKACSDENNGVVVVWEDKRYGSGWDLFAQRLDANGVKMWPDSGVLICKASGDQRFAVIASDDSGGAYIAWEDRRSGTLSSDIFAQHVKPDGSISYAANGVAIGTATRDQEAVTICADGNGGAFVAWEDSRASQTVTRPDIWMNRLTRAGAQWGGTAGRVMINQPNQQRRPRLIDDGQGGCVLVFETTQGIPPGIWAARINTQGAILWGTYGAIVFRGIGQANVARNASVARDGNKFLIAFEVTSLSSSGQDIMAQKMGLDSMKDWSSAAEITGEWPGDQINPRITGDDSSGVIVVFEDLTGDLAPNFYNYDISAVRMTQNGINRFPKYEDGFAYVSHVTRGQRGHEIVKSDDGFIAVWNDGRTNTGDSSIYAQRMTRQMRRQWPNAQSQWGMPIAPSTQYDAKQVVLVPRTNGAIALWSDKRNGNYDIYAQLIFKDGTLPIELASFNAKTNEYGEVVLNWKTASEVDNAGFEVERRLLGVESNAFEVIASYESEASLRGAGNSSTSRTYSYVDQPASGIYEYRIADVGYDGTRTPHTVRRVEVGAAATRAWSMGNAFPNPSNGSSMKLPIVAAESAAVTVKVQNMMGQIVSSQTVYVSAGSTMLALDLPAHLANGRYLYQVSASNMDGGTVWQSSGHALTIQK